MLISFLTSRCQGCFSKERVAAASGRTRLLAREGSRSGKEGLSWLANQAGIRTAS